jgi:hypothetical protein
MFLYTLERISSGISGMGGESAASEPVSPNELSINRLGCDLLS